MPVNIYKTRNGENFVKAVQVQIDTEWTLENKRTMLKKDDYLVKDSDGNLSRMSQTEFENTFYLIR